MTEPAREFRETIWSQARLCADRALDRGTLCPLQTSVEQVRDGGLDYVIRTLTARPDKPPAGDEQPMPYNLLLARDWMWLVPRRRESFDGVSINGLGFAGALLVPDRTAGERLRGAGPGHALESVAGIP